MVYHCPTKMRPDRISAPKWGLAKKFRSDGEIPLWTQEIHGQCHKLISQLRPEGPFQSHGDTIQA